MVRLHLPYSPAVIFSLENLFSVEDDQFDSRNLPSNIFSIVALFLAGGWSRRPDQRRGLLHFEFGDSFTQPKVAADKSLSIPRLNEMARVGNSESGGEFWATAQKFA